MKKLLCCILATAMLLLCVACAPNKQGKTDSSDHETPKTQTSDEKKPEEQTHEGPEETTPGGQTSGEEPPEEQTPEGPEETAPEEETPEEKIPDEPGELSEYIEVGYRVIVGDEPMPVFYFETAYRIKRFQEDDVTVSLSYGWMDLGAYNFPTGKAQVKMAYGESILTLKEVDCGEFFTEDYRVRDVDYDYSDFPPTATMQFAHTEEFTIPSECFTENLGRVYFFVDTVLDNGERIYASESYLYYCREDGRLRFLEYAEYAERKS